MQSRCSARDDGRGVRWSRDVAWRELRRGRADQAFEFSEPGVEDRATASSLAADRRGLPQDGQAVKAKLLAGSCLRILDQGLGPTRARTSRSRPLELYRTIARLAQGWAGRPLSLTADKEHFDRNTRSGR